MMASMYDKMVAAAFDTACNRHVLKVADLRDLREAYHDENIPLCIAPGKEIASLYVDTTAVI